MQAKLSLLVAALLLAIMSVAFAAKPPPEPDTFVGLWEGVWAPTYDLRGLGAVRSITVNNDDTYTIHGRWDGHECVVMGTGVLDDDVLVADDMTEYCSYGTYSTPTTYTFDDTNDVLQEELHFSPSGDTHHTILHKTSR